MRNTQSRLSKGLISQSPTIATLSVLVCLLLNLLPVREANGQGQIVFNNRISNAEFNQTGHIWGPAPDFGLDEVSLIGLGSNDSPAGTTPYAAYGMKLIGDGGASGAVATGDGRWVMGYKTTFSQLIGAIGKNMPESGLAPLSGVTTFRTGSSLGDVAAIDSTFSNNPASIDAPWATLEIVAWDASPAAAARASGFDLRSWGTAGSRGAFDAWEHGLIAGGKSSVFNVANISGTFNMPPFLTSAGAPINGLSFNLYYLIIPEPSMFALAGLGAAALMIFRRRK